MTLPEGIDLRLGRWQDVLADVQADHCITDPPYGERTHNGQRHGRKDPKYCDTATKPLLSSRGINYAAMSVDDVVEFVDRWSTVRGWFVAFTSHDLVDTFMARLAHHGRTTFAPIACVQHGMNVRLAGDGPSNWTTHLVVARPKGLRLWGSLPGAYVGAPHDAGENSLDRSKRAVPGGKPLWLMRAIIGDYTNPGDTVVDPCAGGGTTLLAAAELGCRAIGAEMDPETYQKAYKRLARGFTPLPHPRRHKAQGKAKQVALW